MGGELDRHESYRLQLFERNGLNRSGTCDALRLGSGRVSQADVKHAGQCVGRFSPFRPLAKEVDWQAAASLSPFRYKKNGARGPTPVENAECEPRLTAWLDTAPRVVPLAAPPSITPRRLLHEPAGSILDDSIHYT